MTIGRTAESELFSYSSGLFKSTFISTRLSQAACEGLVVRVFERTITAEALGTARAAFDAGSNLEKAWFRSHRVWSHYHTFLRAMRLTMPVEMDIKTIYRNGHSYWGWQLRTPSNARYLGQFGLLALPWIAEVSVSDAQRSVSGHLVNYHGPGEELLWFKLESGTRSKRDVKTKIRKQAKRSR